MKMEQPTTVITECKATQFVEFLTPINAAAAIVFDEGDPKERLTAVKNKTQKLTEHLRLVMTALETGQDLELVMPKLLEWLRTIDLPVIEKFVVKEFFTKDNPKVRFAWFDNNFTNNFLEMIEENVPATVLHGYRLMVASLDPPIIKALGNFQVSLAHLASMLEKQPNGEKGDLLTDGSANIIYPSDVWAVYAYWSGVGWDVFAYPTDSPDGWLASRQVFGR